MFFPGSLPFKRHFAASIRAADGASVADAAIHLAHRNYQKLRDTLEAPSNRVLRLHLRHSVLPGAAVYQALQVEGLSNHEAIQRVDAGFKRALKLMRMYFKTWGRFPLFFESIRRNTPGFVRRVFPKPGWRITWVEPNEDLVGFDMHSCYYVEVLESLGIPELTPVYCNLDAYFYEDISPHLNFRRAGTLAKGAAVCDFRFERGTPDE